MLKRFKLSFKHCQNLAGKRSGADCKKMGVNRVFKGVKLMKPIVIIFFHSTFNDIKNSAWILA